MLGTSLVAILTAAFLLPGLVAVYFFYRAGQTAEADPVLPSMGSPEGLVQFGCFAIGVHLLYVTGLWLVSSDHPCIPLPLADPYSVLRSGSPGLDSREEQFAVFAGLVMLNLTAAGFGILTGEIVRGAGRLSIFYGPLTDLLRHARGPEAFITAYVLTRTEQNGYTLGYEGIVTSLVRDSKKLPAVVVLKDVTPFRIKASSRAARREPAGRPIENLILRGEDWQNIAFRVYRIE
ncbi:MAG: hypothetical protein P8Y58_05450 [Novosphingobium sp.]